MCGIYGEVAFSKELKTKNNIHSIMKMQTHRGPDDNGVWCNKNQKVLFGHNRLSIIDLSSNGHQPMSDSFGNTIIFNGEIYNYLELKNECIVKGYKFNTQTDTEVILALYHYYGYDCLNKLRGMFAFAIWSEKDEKCFLARDRVGKKPLNYAYDGKRLFFASELNTLVSTKFVSTEIDLVGLNFYLQFQFIPAPHSIYKSIKKLKPAHYVIYEINKFTEYKYWDVSYEEKLDITENDAIDLFENTLKESIDIRLRSDVPLGAFLSGGIDSSLIVALMSELSSEKVNTFSIGFEDKKYSELNYAQMVASKYETNHHPIILKPNIEKLLFKMPMHYGEPFGDKAAIAALAVSEYASSYVKVVLNGDGGDELLGGYTRYKYQNISNSLLPFNMGTSSKILNEFNNYKKPISFIDKMNHKIKYQLIYPEMQSLLSYSSFLNNEERDNLILNNKENNEKINKYIETILDDSLCIKTNSIDRMINIDQKLYLAFDGMPKMDIAAMAYSLEGRSPFIDHKLIELSARLPYNLKVKNLEGKYLIKKLAEKHLPRELIYRQKKGFTIPVKEWLQNELKSMVYNLLLDKKIMEPLNTVYIEFILNKFYKENIDYSRKIWLLLNFAIWKNNLKEII